MRAYITTDLNLRTHTLKASLGLTWGQAFRLACRTQDIPLELIDNQVALFGKWDAESSKALAGHFWGLSKAYDELGQRGKAVAMHKTAKALYTLLDLNVPLNLNVFMQLKGVGNSTVQEAIDFFTASTQQNLTPRSESLVSSGAKNYADNIKRPLWKL